MLPSECRIFQTTIEEVWSSDARVSLSTAEEAADAGWIRASYRRVRTSMDQISEDWVRLSEHACVDLHVHGGSAAVYERKRGCFDRALLQLRTHVTQLGELDPEGVRQAVSASQDLSTQVASCVSEAVYGTFPTTAPSEAEREVVSATANARVQRRLGRTTVAVQLAEEAAGKAEQLGPGGLWVEALVELGHALMAVDRFDDAAGAFQHALGMAVAAEHLPGQADAEGGLGEADLARARVTSALQHFRRALELREIIARDGASVAPGVRAPVGRAHRNLGRGLRAAGDTGGARVEFEAALRADREAFGSEHPEIARATFDLGIIALDEGNAEAAAQQMESAIAMLTRLLHEAHPEVAVLRPTLAVAYQIAGDSERALEQATRAVADTQAALGDTHTEVGHARNNLGWLRAQRGERDAAMVELAAALGIYEARLGADHPDVARAHFNLGKLQLEAGDTSNAATHLARAEAILTQTDAHEDALLDEVRALLVRARTSTATP